MAWRDHTFLMSDVQGSTRLWDRAPEAMSTALARHDALVEEIVEALGGRHVKARGEGDSTFNVFTDPVDAVRAAEAVQRALAAEPWPSPIEIRTRMSLHVGPAEERRDDFYGPTVNRCARIRGTANGGQVVMSAAVAAGLPDTITLIDHGVHRLPDLTEPEHLHELVIDGLPADHPPLKTLDLARHNLPLQRTALVGRDRELVELSTVLSGPRLVTLTGPGGSGKTRLALQVAAELVPSHDDGTWFVPLAPVRSAAAVPAAIVAAVGARIADGDDVVAGLADHLRDQRVLLVLDNCEHVLDPVASVAEQLLTTCPDLRVLATSQAPLGLPGELVRPVPPLSLPTAPGIEAVEASHAVQLFVDRARLARPEFRIDEENAGTVARICSRLDGIPLAIELAAARLRVCTVAQLDGLLDDRFRLLTGGPRSAPDRHRTMRAAIEWSHGLLDDAHRALLHHLAVFVGPFTLDDATVMLDGLDLDVDPFLGVAELVDRSLVMATPESDGSMRHTLLESIREFAWQQLEASDGVGAARDAHLDWILSVYDLDAPYMPEHHWDELDDARAALHHGLTGDRVADAGVLLPRIEAHLFHHGSLVESRELLERAWRRRDEIASSRVLELLILLVDDCWHLDDRDASRRWAEEAAARFDDVDDERVRSRVGVMLGKHHHRDGQLDDAILWMERGVVAARAMDAPAVVANALACLAHVLRESVPDEAAHHLEEAAVLLEGVGSARAAGPRAQLASGLIATDPQRAVAALRELIDVSETGGREDVLVRLVLAMALHACGDDEATDHARKAWVEACAREDAALEIHAAGTLLTVALDPPDPAVVAERHRLLLRSNNVLEGSEGALLLVAQHAADHVPALAARLLHHARDHAAPPLPATAITAVADRLGPHVWPPVSGATERIRALADDVRTWIDNEVVRDRA